MEPRIQYARTTDGVNIAFYKIGHGPPLVITPNNTLSHIQLEWQLPESRHWYERLASSGTVIRYDGRGSGLSDRDVTDFSLDFHVRDLTAVADKLELSRFALMGCMDLGPAAILYAANNSDRVSKLVLWCAYANGSDLEIAPETTAWIDLMKQDWQLGTQSWANNMVGWSDSDLAHRLARDYRESCAAEMLIEMWRASLEFDANEALPRVAVETLVLHRSGIRLLTVDTARRMAATIPNARLSVFDGPATMPYVGDSEAAASAIEEFLGGFARTPATVGPGMTAILFVDIADSTALTERFGDKAFRERARDLDTSLRTIIREHSGTCIDAKTLGDGVLATFTSAAQAIEAALACGKAGARRRLGPPPRTARRRRHPRVRPRRAQQRIRRRRQHRGPYQRPLRAGRGPGVGHRPLAGAHIGRRHVRGPR